MLVNDEYSSWYNKVGDFFKYQFWIGENCFCTSMDQHARPNRTTPFQSAWSTVLSAMTVDYEQFSSICLSGN